MANSNETSFYRYLNGYFFNGVPSANAGKCYPYHSQDFYIYTIRDKKYNVVFDEDDNIITPISKSGYMMTFEVIKQLSGITEKYKIIDINGKAICELGEGWFEDVGYISDDIFYYREENSKETVLIDVAKNKVLKVENSGYVHSDSCVFSNGVYGDSELNEWIHIGSTYYNKDLSGQSVSFSKSNYIGSEMNEVPLTNNRFWHEETIYDYEENPLKEFTEGGVEEIFCYNGVYYVQSENDFFYTLDADFNYICEPKKIESYHLGYLTQSGVTIYNSDTGYKLIDENFNDVELPVSVNSFYDVDNGGCYAYYNSANSSCILYNLVTGKTIENIIIDVK